MTSTYRPVPFGKAICRECDQPYALVDHGEPFINRHGVRQRPRVLPINGPRGNRCPGSHQPPKPWLEATGLPDWEDMNDYDRGAALMFLWKCHWEKSFPCPRENYPARYFDHPLLVELDPETACTHAVKVAGSWSQALERLGVDEAMRLYNLALERERAERASGVTERLASTASEDGTRGEEPSR